jgi:hypothetical protein
MVKKAPAGDDNGEHNYRMQEVTLVSAAFHAIMPSCPSCCCCYCYNIVLLLCMDFISMTSLKHGSDDGILKNRFETRKKENTEYRSNTVSTQHVKINTMALRGKEWSEIVLQDAVRSLSMVRIVLMRIKSQWDSAKSSPGKSRLGVESTFIYSSKP